MNIQSNSHLVRFLLGSINLLIFVTIVLGISGGMVSIVVHLLPERLNSIGVGGSLFVFGLVAVPFCICTFIAAAKNLSTSFLFTALMVFIIGSRLIYFVGIDQPLLSDYLTMWQYVTSVASGGYFPPENVPSVRTLAFLLPTALLFDGWQFSYQIANTLVVGLCAGAVYFLTRELIDNRSALIALTIVAFSPEPLFAVEITSHDIPSAFYLLISLILVLVIVRRLEMPRPHYMTVAGLGVLLGFALFLLDLQRGISVFVYLGISLTIVLFLLNLHGIPEAMKKCARFAAFLIVLPYAVSLTCLSVMNTWLLDDSLASVKSRHTWLWTASYANSESDGSWATGLKPMSPYLSSLDDRELRDFAIARSLSDFADNLLERPQNYVERISRMYLLGIQTYFYFEHAVPTWLIPDAIFSNGLKDLFVFYSLVFAMIFLMAAGVALVFLVLRVDVDPWLYLPVLPMALLTLMLTLMGENQPRYMFPLWFVLPIYIGAMSQMRKGAWALRGEIMNRFAGILYSAFAVCVVLFLVHFFLRASYGLDDGRLLNVRRLDAEGNVQVVGDYQALLMSSMDDPASISGKVTLGTIDGDFSLAFFVRPVITEAVVARIIAWEAGDDDFPATADRMKDDAARDPEPPVTRGGIAALLLRGMHGADYLPPPASGRVFRDVPREAPEAAWIEQLAAEGITGGCGSESYCPNDELTGTQLAAFLTRGLGLPMERAQELIPTVSVEVFIDGHRKGRQRVPCGDPLRLYRIGIGSPSDGEHQLELRAEASSDGNLTCPVHIDFSRLSQGSQ